VSFWHSGILHSERECKALLFLTVIVSITFVITGGGAKAAKHNVKITKITQRT